MAVSEEEVSRGVIIEAVIGVEVAEVEEVEEEEEGCEDCFWRTSVSLRRDG